MRLWIHNNIFDTHGSSEDLLHSNANSSKGLVIEEIDSDDEGEGEEGQNGNSGVVTDDKPHRVATSSKDPLIEHPDDEEKVKKETRINKNHNRTKTQSISLKKLHMVVVLEDTKEADKTTGQATHRISKGIHDKGHSVTRKLGTDGEVQTLHNLNQGTFALVNKGNWFTYCLDELASFEEEWEGNADMHIPDWNEEFNSFGKPRFGSMGPFGLALEAAGGSQRSGRLRSENQEQTSSSRSQPKKFFELVPLVDVM
uniref:Uncharacterized protein n=1 Tax=Lactuca sativa TaxID=4236 RepID=A0A9R1WXN6_LACSA|nr:hypothetical protein LSAT_V11C800423500 [Lactuca sativa]